MGLFSGLFGGGGSAKRAAQVAASKEAEAGALVESRFQESKKGILDQLAAGQGAVSSRYAEVSPYYTPYREAGTGALSQYQGVAATLPEYTSRINQYAAGIDPIMAQIQSKNLNDFQTSPGYDFRFQQGQRALEASKAAQGMSGSGATGKALLEYGQGIGAQEYQSYLDRLYKQIGGVQAQIGGVQAGQQSAGQTLDAYGNLINTGYNAAGAAAALGMNEAQYRAALGEAAQGQIANLGAGAAQQQAQRIANTGEIYAGGMQAKDTQMKAAGDQWIKMAAMAAGGAAGGIGGAQLAGSMAPQFAGSSEQPASSQPMQAPSWTSLSRGFQTGYGGQASVMPLSNPGGIYSNPNPWVNPDQAQIQTSSSYSPRRYLS